MLALAVAALALAVEIRDGLGHPAAFLALAVACLAGLAALGSPSRSVSTPGILGLVVAGFGAAPFLTRLASQTATDAGVSTPAWVAASLGAAALATAAAGFGRLDPRAALASALIACGLAGAWIITRVPTPHIDVWWSQNAGIDAFLSGGNPYTSTFPDLYDDLNGYALGIVRDGRVRLGYPYPPVTLLLDAPFRALFGDIRWGHLVGRTRHRRPDRRPTPERALHGVRRSLPTSSPADVRDRVRMDGPVGRIARRRDAPRSRSSRSASLASRPDSSSRRNRR
jgi:hypothetical protein